MDIRFTYLREAIKTYKANHVSGDKNYDVLKEFITELEYKNSDSQKSSVIDGVIHSSPITGNYYWIQCHEDTEWEVAYCRMYDNKPYFYMYNGSRKECKYVSDWKKTPIH